MSRLQEIRTAERESHQQAYEEHELYAPGSWLAKPVKTVLELIPLFADYREFRALDLGCGVGRNSIALAKEIPGARIDCVDILPFAIEKLQENALRYQTAGIRGIVQTIDLFAIPEDHYDLILGISALEHMDSEASFQRKLQEISRGIRERGVVCLIINSNVVERDRLTGEEIPAQFEVNLPKAELLTMLKRAFAGWDVILEKIVHQSYDIPRGERTAALGADVVTWVVRRK